MALQTVMPVTWGEGSPVDADTPKDEALLTYGDGFEIAHYNTLFNRWVTCWDHRDIATPTRWWHLPQMPKQPEA